MAEAQISRALSEPVVGFAAVLTAVSRAKIGVALPLGVMRQLAGRVVPN